MGWAVAFWQRTTDYRILAKNLGFSLPRFLHLFGLGKLYGILISPVKLGGYCWGDGEYDPLNGVLVVAGELVQGTWLTHDPFGPLAKASRFPWTGLLLP